MKLDPVRYQARVDRLQADLMTATHNIKTLRAQLTEAQANTNPGFSGARPSVSKIINVIWKGSQAAVNPFSERDIDDARRKFPRAGCAGERLGGGAGADPEPARQYG